MISQTRHFGSAGRRHAGDTSLCMQPHLCPVGSNTTSRPLSLRCRFCTWCFPGASSPAASRCWYANASRPENAGCARFPFCFMLEDDVAKLR